MGKNYNSKEFMIRRSIYKVNNVDKFNLDIYKEVIDDPVFLEQIFIASPSLYNSIQDYRTDPSKFNKKDVAYILESTNKYLKRSKYRTTPFGLFSSVGLGEFNDIKQTTVHSKRIRKHIDIDGKWLYKLISSIELKHKQNLKWQINNSVYKLGDRKYLLYCVDKKKIERINVKNTKLFDLVNASCERGKKYKDIINEIIKWCGKDYEENVIKYINQLIENEFLISELRGVYNVTESLIFLSDAINEFDEELSKKILKLSNLIEEYAKLDMGTGISKYRNIIDHMREIVEADNYLTVDLFDKSKIQLEEGIKNNIIKFIDYLMKLAAYSEERYDTMNEYKNRFLEKYGYFQEVQLLELLDETHGIGLPYGYKNSIINTEIKKFESLSPKIRRYFEDKYNEAIYKEEAIELNNRELTDLFKDDIININKERYSSSLELYFFIKEESGIHKLYLSQILGSTRAGKTFGRFYKLDKSVEDLIVQYDNLNKASLIEKECEVILLPQDPSLTNVTRTINNKDKVLNLHVYSNNNNDNIKLEDIYICIDNKGLYCKDIKSNERIVFDSNNMFNTMLIPNEIRFLYEISLNRKYLWSNVPWKIVYDDYNYIPEIRYQSIVVSPRKWKISKNNNLRTSNVNEFIKDFYKFSETFNIPEDIYISEFDNRLKINILEKEDLKILFNSYKKLENNNKIILEEIEKGKDILIDENNILYPCEIVVPFYNTHIRAKEDLNKPEIALKRTNEIQRDFLPFDKWLYIKIYCSEEVQDKFLTEHLIFVLKELVKDFDFEFYYMRYRDPKSHIRLRIKHKDNYNIYKKMLPYFNDYRNRKIINHVILDTYEREIERYGGHEFIEEAEKLFFYDSRISMKLIDIVKNYNTELDKVDMVALSIYHYLEDFGLNKYEKVEFFDNLGIRNINKDSSLKEKREHYFNLIDLKNDLSKYRHGEDIIELFKERSKAIIKYSDKIKGLSKTYKYQIIESVIHMNINRISGINNKIEIEIMEILSQIIKKERYQKQI